MRKCSILLTDVPTARVQFAGDQYDNYFEHWPISWISLNKHTLNCDPSVKREMEYIYHLWNII